MQSKAVTTVVAVVAVVAAALVLVHRLPHLLVSLSLLCSCSGTLYRPDFKNIDSISKFKIVTEK